MSNTEISTSSMPFLRKSQRFPEALEIQRILPTILKALQKNARFTIFETKLTTL